mmetsp:Transcript_13506/g.18520  ORF Transcript_13506/g.18520 Transcript_13506/m.18520 type:complete len:213 (+) Transcript_13506:2595-3233(+)
MTLEDIRKTQSQVVLSARQVFGFSIVVALPGELFDGREAHPHKELDHLLLGVLALQHGVQQRVAHVAPMHQRPPRTSLCAHNALYHCILDSFRSEGELKVAVPVFLVLKPSGVILLAEHEANAHELLALRLPFNFPREVHFHTLQRHALFLIFPEAPLRGTEGCLYGNLVHRGGVVWKDIFWRQHPLAGLIAGHPPVQHQVIYAIGGQHHLP